MKTLTRSIIITLSILALAAWAAWAGDLTIPNTFTGGTTAVASQVNDNFTEVETEVDDNDTRITTNAGNISTNASGISTNASNLIEVAEAFSAVKSVNLYIDTEVTSVTAQNIASMTVTPPADGYIILTACGPVGINKTTAANNYVYAYLTTTSGGTSNYYAFYRNSGADNCWGTFSITASFAVNKSVATTFYLTAERDNSGSNYVYVGMYRTTLTAIFVPVSMP